MKVFSLNTIPERAANLEVIIPIILKQSDLLYVNLIGYKYIPKVLDQKNIIINIFEKGGSELRFYNYKSCDDDTYYFTIDDDILYPENYSLVMIETMKKYNNKVICCVHGSDVDLNLNKNFYKENRKVYKFYSKCKERIVMIPGVGTSCFYKGNISINLEDFKVSNMSDVYVASFAYKQNIPVICVSREQNWLIPLNEYNKKIWGNNPHEHIDEVINKTFKN